MMKPPKQGEHSGKTRRRTIGKLKPVHSLLLNPHAAVKLSRCPHCDKPTFPRKFALFIHVDGWGPYIQGKTCKYCSHCAMIMVQQDELEQRLAEVVSIHCPAAIGREYFIIGVVESKTFKKGLAGSPGDLRDTLDHVSDIRKQYGLSYTPGGWYHKGTKPPVLPGRRPQRIPAADDLTPHIA